MGGFLLAPGNNISFFSDQLSASAASGMTNYRVLSQQNLFLLSIFPKAQVFSQMAPPELGGPSMNLDFGWVFG